ncbi:spore coat protein CotJB [Siminovitchia sp. FSL H7-0308]|uniref:Spore coat protein JB n=1 Tax=Siminovitchia thermophila TaxID=1245522 RepID=A0ABS2R1Z8_9BACI|nr:spore coat protein CotJB [Siminovitchia thermophila]MBM7713662.1 spore coat protein JB [Siminovitchia thermophila]
MKQMPPEYYSQLEEIQTIDFVLVELTLYLDTHPNDMDAIRQYNEYIKLRKTAVKKFEKQFGALSHGSTYSRHPWDWKEAPWPWQV